MPVLVQERFTFPPEFATLITAVGGCVANPTPVEVAAKTTLVNSAKAEPLPQRRRTLLNVLSTEIASGACGWPPSVLVKSGSSQIVSAVGALEEYTLLTT